jgi:PHD/YefM family antitoxin component YafN of YafNO toxin-antitoxin module
MYITYMSVEMPVSQARAELGPVTARAEYNGETTYLLKHGYRAAAVVPVAVAELVEQIEDLLDRDAVAEVLAKLEAGTEESVPFVRRTRRQTS